MTTLCVSECHWTLICGKKNIGYIWYLGKIIAFRRHATPGLVYPSTSNFLATALRLHIIRVARDKQYSGLVVVLLFLVAYMQS